MDCKIMKLNSNQIFCILLIITPFTISLWQFSLLVVAYFNRLFSINKNDCIFILLLTPLFIHKFILLTIYEFANYLYYSFSFLLFYFIFRNIKINFNHISLIMIVFHILELISIYVFNLSGGMTSFTSSNNVFSIFGENFRRPEGIFTNSTQSSIFYIFLFLFSNDKLIKSSLILCIFTFFSGSGIILFVTSVFVTQHIKLIFKLGLVVFALFLSMFINKISYGYILFNLKLKYELLLKYLNSTEIMCFFFGNDVSINFSDFGLIYLLDTYGLYGLIIIIAYSLIIVDKYNYNFLIIFFLSSTIHYPLISKILGSLIFGYLLTLNFKKSIIIKSLKNFNFYKLQT